MTATQTARKSKSKKSVKEPVEEVPVVVVEEVPVVVVPVVEPVVEEPVEEPVTEEDQPLTLEQRLEQFRETLSGEIKSLGEKMKTLKTLDQDFKRISLEIKRHIKTKVKRVRAPGQSNHGFNAPGLVSDELADFLRLERGCLLRRPQVGSLISKYANANGLKDPANGSIFLPDAALKKILGPAVYPVKKESDLNGYSIFNLQKYLKRHFIKVDA